DLLDWLDLKFRRDLAFSSFGKCALQILRGNGIVSSVCVVGSRHEDVVVLGESKSPGVVAGAGEVFEVLSVRIQAVDSLRKTHLLAIDCAVEPGVSGHAPDLVVKAVL